MAKKRATTKKSSTRKASTAKKSTAKKSTAKKAAPKKSTAKKPTAKKAAPKKSTAKKSTAKKPAAKKPAAKKTKKKAAKKPANKPAILAYLVVKDVRKSLEFYEKAFGFKTKYAMGAPGKKPVHASMTHGDHEFMLGAGGKFNGETWSPPGNERTRSHRMGLYVYVRNVNNHRKGLSRYRGLKVTEPTDEFWGDRTYKVVDRDGHHWTFAQAKKIVSPEEMAEAMQAMGG